MASNTAAKRLLREVKKLKPGAVVLVNGNGNNEFPGRAEPYSVECVIGKPKSTLRAGAHSVRLSKGSVDYSAGILPRKQMPTDYEDVTRIVSEPVAGDKGADEISTADGSAGFVPRPSSGSGSGASSSAGSGSAAGSSRSSRSGRSGAAASSTAAPDRSSSGDASGTELDLSSPRRATTSPQAAPPTRARPARPRTGEGTTAEAAFSSAESAREFFGSVSAETRKLILEAEEQTRSCDSSPSDRRRGRQRRSDDEQADDMLSQITLPGDAMCDLQHTFKEEELEQFAQKIKTAFTSVIDQVVNMLVESETASAGDRSAVLRSVRDGLVSVILTLPRGLQTAPEATSGELFSERNLRINVLKSVLKHVYGGGSGDVDSADADPESWMEIALKVMRPSKMAATVIPSEDTEPDKALPTRYDVEKSFGRDYLGIDSAVVRDARRSWRWYDNQPARPCLAAAPGEAMVDLPDPPYCAVAMRAPYNGQGSVECRLGVVYNCVLEADADPEYAVGEVVAVGADTSGSLRREVCTVKRLSPYSRSTRRSNIAPVALLDNSRWQHCVEPETAIDCASVACIVNLWEAVTQPGDPTELWLIDAEGLRDAKPEVVGHMEWLSEK
jgi:hypothetical protein